MSEKPKRKISLYNKSAASFSNKKFKLVTKTVRSNSPVGNYADRIAERAAERSAAAKEAKNGKTSASEESLITDADSEKNDNIRSRRKRADQLKQMIIETDNIPNTGYGYEDEYDNDHSINSKTNESVDIGNDRHDPEKDKKDQSCFFGSTAKSNTENAAPDMKKRAAIAQAYKQAILKKQMQGRQSAIEINYRQQVNSALLQNMRAKDAAEFTANADKFCRDNVIGGVEELSGFIGAMSSGSAEKIIAQPVESVIRKNLSNGTNQIIDSITTVTGAVAGADSIGNAASNVGITLAAQEIKKAAKNIFLTPSDKRIEDRLQKKFRYIDKKTEDRLKKIEKEKKEALNGNINSKTEKEFQKIERSKEQYKEKLAKQQRDIQRKTAQKSIYIKHNRNNPAFTGSKAACVQKKLLKKKKKIILLGGAGGGAFMGLAVIIIILVLISSLFSWLTPNTYSLAGDEGSGTNANTNAEILDGYTLLVKNYFDVKQAYFYLDYSDWYGGSYSYSDASIDFGEYVTEYVADVIEKIQKSYEAEIEAANGDPKRLEAISREMSKAIAEAMKTVQAEAKASYDELVGSLNDELRATEKRRHYEIARAGGKNGKKDSEEFAGPIVGTNKFDDVEIDSDLSAEELTALIAIYKTMTNTGETPSTSDDENEETENIYAISPKDIMTFFDKTEYIKIEQTFTGDHQCEEGNCTRRLVGNFKSGYSWEYSCPGNHIHMSGKMTVKTKDELIEKLVEILNDQNNTTTTVEECNEIFDAYMDMFNKELGDNKRYFGAADNSVALTFYNMLINPEMGEIPNNFWKNNSDESTGDDNDGAS